MTPHIFKTTCSYCGVGCGIEILKHPDSRLELRGDENHPANRGLLCSKGRMLLHTVSARETRLHFPVMREAKTAERQRVSWDRAFSHIAARFKDIIAQHGPDAIAFYISGQCLTEEYYLANKLVKGFLQTNNIDTNSRLCMSSAVAGYKATLGADAPPTCYEDIDHADTFLIAGANPAWCHPVLFRRIEARKAADPNVKVILIDPRRTASAEIADLHLQIIPGTDVALFLGLARQLAHTSQIDGDFLNNHVENAEAFLQSAEPWTLAATADACGVAEHAIETAAAWLGGPRRFLSLWTMGLNQSAVGTDKNIALISLSLITGKIGKPGCGPFSLTGQPNAMGGREVGGMANLLPAHRDLANASHREQVARFWGVPAISEKPGLTAVELFDAIDSGQVKAVWIAATNPIASMPHAAKVEAALQKAELVIVQDIYPTQTTALADIILPAAGWLEKNGTMTNSDRRIALLEKVIEPPGEALPDAEIFRRFASHMGWQQHFDYTNSAAIFAEHAALTANTDIDITGLSHTHLKEHGPTQWPFPVGTRSVSKGQSTFPPEGTLEKIPAFTTEIPIENRLYTNATFPTATGRAKLHALTFQNLSEPTSSEFPLILTTGRIRDQWHTMTKTGQVNRLRTHIDAPFCEIHPDDAAAGAIAEGDIVTIANARGQVRVPATITTTIRSGTIFLPMHFTRELARANNLTSPRLDPVSKEPDLKFAAVRLERYIPPKRRIVIIGAGAAALAFVEAHRRFNERDDILLLGGESLPVYNRVLLPHYIQAGGGDDAFVPMLQADADALNPPPHRVVFHPNTLVARIDRAGKTITDSRGRTFPYDTLILATGSRAAIHYDGPLPRRNVFTLRSRRDADDILRAVHAGLKRVVIQGAGLLALELADALQQQNCSVMLLQRSSRIMSKQLDPTASDLLVQQLRQRGIEILLDTQLVELHGEEKIESVRIQTSPHSESKPQNESSKIDCDLFVFATGTLPNKELAGAAGLDCEKGVLVNDHLQTSDPAIFAIGECAQFQDHLIGTTAAARIHAQALAHFLRGNLHAPLKPTPQANVLKISGIPLACSGQTHFEEAAANPAAPTPSPAPENLQTLTLLDSALHTYQKLLIHNDRLIGAICLGDISNFPTYQHYIETGLELDDLRATLLRPGTSASTNGQNGHHASPLICSCHQIHAATIQAAAPACDHSLPRVCQATRAGTGCGSCRPEIARLLAQCKTLPAL